MGAPVRNTSRATLGVLCLLAAHVCLASAGARAQLISIGITKNVDLNFGQVLIGASSGTVVITPSGSRSATGGAMLGSGAAASSASFTVSGEALSTYSITLPSSITLSSGGPTMTVQAFTRTPSGTGTLNILSRQTLTVGATLLVNAAQTSGTYTGSFLVRVDYN